MLVSFIIFALSVATYFWVDLPWYYCVPIAVGVFVGLSFTRALLWSCPAI